MFLSMHLNPFRILVFISYPFLFERSSQTKKVSNVCTQGNKQQVRANPPLFDPFHKVTVALGPGKLLVGEEEPDEGPEGVPCSPHRENIYTHARGPYENHVKQLW